MAYDEDAVVELVEAALDGADADLQPGFYVVAGSHTYGFADETSVVDVRGMHMADGNRYMLLDTPRNRVSVNTDDATDGFERWAGVELRSHELRALADALTDSKVSAVESVLAGEVVLDTLPEYTDALRDIVASALPLGLPAAYYGRARSIHDRFLVSQRTTTDGTADHYLQAIRSLLAAEYVTDNADLLADVCTLSTTILGDDDVVADLITTKRTGDGIDDTLHARARDLLDDLFARTDPPEAQGVDRLRIRLDEWMLDLRREVTKPL